MTKNYPTSNYSLSNFLLVLMGLFMTSFAFGQTNTYTASGSWPGVANITHVTVEAWGRGGNGGTSPNTNNNTGAGGGGGGYSRRKDVAIPASTPYTFTIAATTTSTINGVVITANSGTNATGNTTAGTGGSTVGAVGDAGAVFAGGNGILGTNGSFSGGGGGSGGGNGAGSAATNATGGAAGIAGSFTSGANGANGYTYIGPGNNTATGANGNSPGSGGSGGFGKSIAGGNGATGQIQFRYITVSGIAPSTTCIGSTITITGTGFATTGSTTVTVGGISCTGITVVNATTITAVVAAGTAVGSQIVDIVNPNGRNNGKSITVDASSIPTITTQPTATGICTTASGNFSVVATGATSYQWRRNGINLTNTAPYSNVGTATLTITNPAVGDAGNFDVVVSNAAGCSVTSTTATLTVNTVPAAAATPTPANAATGICYAGTGILSNISWGAVAGATSYDVYFGAGSIPGSVTANVATNSYSVGTLSASTTYYWRVVAKNACGDAVTSATYTFTTAATPCIVPYCIPTIGAAYDASIYYIKTVNFIGNISNSNNTSTSSASPNNGYQDHTGLGSRATQAQEEGVNIFVDNELGASPVYMKAWVDWNKNSLFDDATEMVYQCTNAFVNTTFGFQIPLATTPGDYRIRFRTNRASSAADNTFSSCGNINNYGETEDYLFTVVANCAAKIVSKVDGSNCGTGTVTLSATGTAGTTSLNWYTAGGTFITNTPTTGLTASWTTPSIISTTNYYVTALNGSCESLFRTLVTATIKPVPTLSFSNANPEVCGEDDIITLSATGTNEQIYLIDESFETGLGVFSNNQIASPNGTVTNWQSRTSTYVPQYPTFPVWYPAVSSGFGTNRFAMSTSDLVLGGTTAGKVNEALELTSTVNTTGFLNLNLSFKIYFSSYNDLNSAAVEGVFVEFRNGAGPWTAVADVNGTILTDQGIGTQFITKSINLAPQIGITNLQIRIRYRAGWCDGVAIDDVKLYGDMPLVPNFTWTGLPAGSAFTDLACTIPYVSGATLTGPVYIKPTLSQLETAGYSFTANANLNNGCTSSATINVTNKTKVWKGTTSNDWNVSSNWAPSVVPTATDCVIIPTGTTSQIMNAPNALAKNLTVKAPTGNLELQSGFNLKVTDWINVETGATFNVRNSANLVQVNDAPVPANAGSINMNRTATGLHPKDYVYWSTPVENFGVASVSPLTNTSRIYQWVPDVNNGVGITEPTYGFGNWANINENMVAGKGYIIRVADSNPSFTATFTGKPQNGVITKSIVRGPYTGTGYVGANGLLITNEDDNWNLIGNPYPSAIDADEFLTANSASIAGQISLWTHSSPISITSSPYYQAFIYNYKSSDYITYNKFGPSSGPKSFAGKIGAGQGFFVQMTDAAATPNTITFNNGMRTDASNDPYINGEFFRANDNTTSTEEEKHRIWLDLIDSTLNTSRVLIGYSDGATNGKDRMYDATTNYNEKLKAFTTIDNDEQIYVIQAKGLPFDPADKISYGIQVPATGTYKIAISDVDGLFKTQGQKIYIEDMLTNVTQDLSTSPYTFTADKGTYKNRFVIKFDNQTLSNNDHEFANSVTVFGKQQLTVKSELFNIKNIVVYDLLGKTLLNNKDVNSKEYHLPNLKNTNSALLVKTTLENGAVVTKKVIF